MIQNSQQNGIMDKEMKRKLLIRKFGITQVVIAIICIILGIVDTVLIAENTPIKVYSTYSGRYYYYRMPIWGSGIWSSVFTVIAGGIGIGIGSPTSGKGMMVAHMVFAIIGCVSEGTGIIMSSIFCAIIASFPINSIRYYCIIYIVLCILSIINFSFLITTSVFCCKLLKCCCGAASERQATYTHQTMVQTPHVMMMQQPQDRVMMQQPQGTVMMQQPAGAIMMQQPQGTVMMQQPQRTVMMQKPQDFEPQNQPQTYSQNTSNLFDSEGFVQLQETKVAPPSYS